MDTRQTDFRKSLWVATVAMAQLINGALCIAALANITSAQFVLAQKASNGEATKESTNSEKQHPNLAPSAEKHSLSLDQCSSQVWPQNKDNWEIAKANVDTFLGLDPKALTALFKRVPTCLECNIELDDNTILRFDTYKKIESFAILPHDAHSMEGSYGEDSNYEHPRVKSEAVWTGAKRKDEKEYWTIIKNNLNKFTGMNKEQIVSVLGPERESSTPWNYIRYRVGDASLTFYMKDGKVEKYRFQSDIYIPGT